MFTRDPAGTRAAFFPRLESSISDIFLSAQALPVYPMQRAEPIVAIYEVPSPTNMSTTAAIILFSAQELTFTPLLSPLLAGLLCWLNWMVRR